MGKEARKPTTAPAEESVASDGVELPERWSVQRKTEVVLRLLRGETRAAALAAGPWFLTRRDRTVAPGSTIVAGAIP